MTPRFLELLSALDRHSVEHVVVGGVAAILEGAPMTTLDLASVIASKEVAGRDKDKAMLPLLRQTLALKREERR